MGTASGVVKHLESFFSSNPVRTARSDRGPEFVNSQIAAMCARLGIKWYTTASGHPQANGATERVHLDFKRVLPPLRKSFPHLSDFQRLLTAVRAENESSAGTTQLSPMFLAYGRASRADAEQIAGGDLDPAEQRRLASVAWQHAQERKLDAARAATRNMTKKIYYQQFWYNR